MTTIFAIATLHCTKTHLLLNNAISNIWQLIENPPEIAKCLYCDIFSSSELGMAEKIELLAAKLPDLEEDDVRNYLSILALEDFIKIFDPRSRPRIKKTSVNESLLNAFQTCGWIYDYTDDSSSNNYYGIRRRAPRGRG